MTNIPYDVIYLTRRLVREKLATFSFTPQEAGMLREWSAKSRSDEPPLCIHCELSVVLREGEPELIVGVSPVNSADGAAFGICRACVRKFMRSPGEANAFIIQCIRKFIPDAHLPPMGHA